MNDKIVRNIIADIDVKFRELPKQLQEDIADGKYRKKYGLETDSGSYYMQLKEMGYSDNEAQWECLKDDIMNEKYRDLNDGSKYFDGLEKGNTEIWYTNDYYWHNAGFGIAEDIIDIDDLKKTHVYLGKIKETNLEKIFKMLQGEFWSMFGEARNFIQSKDTHTSMSVGDIIKKGSKYYGVDNTGFMELKRKKQAGSMGKFSGDASDVLDGIVMMNKSKSVSQILKIVKKDDFLMNEADEMNISDKELKQYIKDSKMIHTRYGSQNIIGSRQRYCGFYKAKDDNWYMELAGNEYGKYDEATTYGPFSSFEKAEKYLHDNFSNPGGYDEEDDRGTEKVPKRSPNGRPIVKPKRRM